MQISTSLLGALLFVGLSTAAPAPTPEPWRQVRGSRSGGSQAGIRISGSGRAPKQSFFDTPRPYAINDKVGFVDHRWDTHTYATPKAAKGPKGNLAGIDKAIPGVCAKLIGEEANAEELFAAGETKQRWWRMPNGQAMYARLELLDGKIVSRQSCENELRLLIKYYGYSENGQMWCNNAWSYTHDGHVKHSLEWERHF